MDSQQINMGDAAVQALTDADNTLRDQANNTKAQPSEKTQSESTENLTDEQRKAKTDLENRQWLEKQVFPVIQEYQDKVPGQDLKKIILDMPVIKNLMSTPTSGLAEQAKDLQVGKDVSTPRNLHDAMPLIKNRLDSIVRQHQLIMNAPKPNSLTRERGIAAFNLKNYKLAQYDPQSRFPVSSVGDFIEKFLNDILSYTGKETGGDQLSGQAVSEIQKAVGQGFEQEANSALKTIAERSSSEMRADPIKEATRILSIIYEKWLSPSMKAEEKIAMKKIDLSDKVVNNLNKTAAQHYGQESLLYGPTEKRICPKLRGKGGGPPGSNDIVSEYTCRHLCMDAIVIDDHKTVCGEAIFRAHVMEKQQPEYVDENGNIKGGTIESRFEVNHNVPEETNMHLKPGERRKPRPASQGNLESRMQDMRSKEAEKRKYRPVTDTSKPFDWTKHQDQNNVEVSQSERDSREKDAGHKTVVYKNREQGENNPKMAFNLKAYKTAQSRDYSSFFEGEDLNQPKPRTGLDPDFLGKNPPGKITMNDGRLIDDPGYDVKDDWADIYEADEYKAPKKDIDEEIDAPVAPSPVGNTDFDPSTAQSIDELVDAYGSSLVDFASKSLGFYDDRFMGSLDEVKELEMLKGFFQLYKQYGQDRVDNAVNSLGLEDVDNPEYEDSSEDPMPEERLSLINDLLSVQDERGIKDKNKQFFGPNRSVRNEVFQTDEELVHNFLNTPDDAFVPMQDSKIVAFNMKQYKEASKKKQRNS